MVSAVESENIIDHKPNHSEEEKLLPQGHLDVGGVSTMTAAPREASANAKPPSPKVDLSGSPSAIVGITDALILRQQRIDRGLHMNLSRIKKRDVGTGIAQDQG